MPPKCKPTEEKEDEYVAYDEEYAKIHNPESTLLPCGLRPATYRRIVEELQEHARNIHPVTVPYNIEEAVHGVFFHMYSGGKWNVTVDYMQHRFKHGWGRSSCFSKLRTCASDIERHVYPKFVNWSYASAENNSSTDTMEKAYSIFFDTAPISVDEGANSYNPKYAECIVKLMLVITFTGLVVEARLTSGTSCDSVVQDFCEVDKKLRELGLFAAADGGFHQSDRTDIPYPKNRIWPEVLEDGQTLEDYKEAAHQKMKFNEGLGFWRARVEHFFSRIRWGRFSMFKNYQGFQHYLPMWVKCSIVAMNIEVLVSHTEGYYPPLTESKKRQFAATIERHPIQTARYPMPAQPLTKEQYKEQGLRWKPGPKPKFIPKNAEPETTTSVKKTKEMVVATDTARVEANVKHWSNMWTYPQLGERGGTVEEQFPLPNVNIRDWAQRHKYIPGPVIDAVLRSHMIGVNQNNPVIAAHERISTLWQELSKGIAPELMTRKSRVLLPAFFTGHWVLFRVSVFDDCVKLRLFNSLETHAQNDLKTLIQSVKELVSKAYERTVHFASVPTPQQEESECAVHVVNNALHSMGIEFSYTRATLHAKAVALSEQKAPPPAKPPLRRAPMMIDSDEEQ